MDTKLFVRKQPGGMFTVIDKGLTTGSIFWVCSSTGTDAAGYGQNPDAPFASIDYAVGQCTASKGDRIYVMTGHTESVIAAGGLDLDVAGITIEFLGEGNGRGCIQFGTSTSADMDIDAADVTLINPRFVAAIDALTGPIDVNAARFKMFNATWQDGTDINTTDCLVADANADDMVIDGFEFVDGNAGGTQKQSFIQVAGATRPTIKRVKCTGDFGTGIIENGTAWVDAYLEDLVLDNASASPTVAIYLKSTSSGQARNCHLRVASGTTYVTADNDMQWFECYGTGTDATAGEKVGTQLAGDVEAKVDVIDGYHDVATANTSTNTVMRDAIGNKTDTAVTAGTTTKSIMAYTKGVLSNQAVPTANTSTNAFVRDAVGNKSDAAYTTASSTKSVMAYTKAILGFNTVATANTSTNARMRDVVGNKTDSVYTTGAVTTTKSLMNYIKAIHQNAASGDPNVNRTNYMTVTATLNSATWLTKASHEVVNVSGVCRVRILPICTTSLDGSAATLIKLGTSSSGSNFIANTTATYVDANETWVQATSAHVSTINYSSILDKVVHEDIGYTISGKSSSGGVLVFHVWWDPLTATSKCTAGTGGAL